MIGDVYPGPSPIQWVVIAGFISVSAALLVIGYRTARRQWRTRGAGATMPGSGIGMVLGGIAISIATVQVALPLLTGRWEHSAFSYWWFLPDPVPGQPSLISFLANPAANILVIAVFVYFLDVPSRTNIRHAIGEVADPVTRSGALWLAGVAIITLAGGALGAWAVTSLIGPVGAIPGTYLGGFAAMGGCIAITVVVTRARRRRENESGGAS